MGRYADVMFGFYLLNEVVKLVYRHILADGEGNTIIRLVIKIPIGLWLFGFDLKDKPVKPFVCFFVLSESQIDGCQIQIRVAMGVFLILLHGRLKLIDGIVVLCTLPIQPPQIYVGIIALRSKFKLTEIVFFGCGEVFL